MKLKSLILVLFFFILSCEDNQPPPPSNLIDKDTIIDIMVDMALSDAMVENKSYEDNKTIYTKKHAYYKSIFSHYNITSEDFETSYQYYLNEIDSAAAMYDIVLEKINIKQIEQ